MHRLFFAILLTLLPVASPPAAAMPYDTHSLADDSITAMAMGWKGYLIVATRDGKIAALKNDGECIILAAGLGETRCLAVSPRGDIFAASATAGCVIRLDRVGNMAIVASDLGEIHGLAVDRDGRLLVSHGPTGTLTHLECPRETPGKSPNANLAFTAK